MFYSVHRMGCVDDHQFKMAATTKCKQTNNIKSDIDVYLTYNAKINRNNTFINKHYDVILFKIIACAFLCVLERNLEINV